MIICAGCKKEMVCVKTGMSVRYREDGSHVYPADTFECPVCGARVANTGNSDSYFQPDDNKRVVFPEDIWMDSDGNNS